MKYKIKLSEEEVKSLGWFVNRGYFPEDLFNGMIESDIQDNDNYINYEIQEYRVWSLIELKEDDPDAYLSCMGGRLLEEILKLENSIV